MSVKHPTGGSSRCSPGMIRLLEELTINAWPAFQTFLYDGWVIRFAGGYTRRSNSVIPLYPSQTDILKKIRLCEEMYRGRGRRAVFKMTAASDPPELDSILADNGYRRAAETGVQTLSLGNGLQALGADVLLEETLTEEWLSALCAMNAYEPSQHQTVRMLTGLIPPPRIFASIRREERIIACGLGVIRQRHLACFDIVVDADHRRQGLGKQIMTSLLDWGKCRSAEKAFLQVTADNPVARELYAVLGFREEYRYWYRVKE